MLMYKSNKIFFLVFFYFVALYVFKEMNRDVENIVKIA
jgi:hypothetical protein